MTLNPELVTVVAGGMNYRGWEQVDISYAINEATRTFRLMTTERTAFEWTFPPGTPITILANGTLIVTGYVNSYAPDISDRQHSITITGRGKCQDIIDCAAMYEPGFWENRTPDQIMKDLDRFGAGVTAEVPMKPIPMFQLYQGERAFQAGERAIRAQGVTAREKADGSMALTNASVAGRHAGGLIEGVNIKRASGQITDHQRHSEYEVKGQARLGHGDAALRVAQTAMDSGVSRYRPMIIVNEADTDADRAMTRAEHERDRRQGLSVKATITTQGWRDEAGEVFEPNFLIPVTSPSLKILGDMLIERVQLKQDGGPEGSTATLSLVNAKAYGGDGGANESDAAWG